MDHRDNLSRWSELATIASESWRKAKRSDRDPPRFQVSASSDDDLDVGRRAVAARVQRASSSSVIRAVNAAYRDKYRELWPDSARAVVRRSRLNTTLRLIAT